MSQNKDNLNLKNSKKVTDECKKYPSVIAGVFIFNDKDELLMIKSSAFKNKYSNVGGHVGPGETITATARRKVKEETGLEIEGLIMVDITDGLGLGDSYTKDEDHLIFVDYKTKAKKYKKIKLNHEATSFKWQKLDAWLKLSKDKFAPYIYEVLLKLKLEPIESKEELSGLYKRALADYQNLLRQTRKEKEEFFKYANESFLYEIIPVYDNLKISMDHVDEIASKSGWAEGIKYVIKQFKDVLDNIGVKEIKTVGEKFDHNTMDAVEGKGEKVIKEVKPGYKLRDKVIIPAKVILEKGKEEKRGGVKEKNEESGGDKT